MYTRILATFTIHTSVRHGEARAFIYVTHHYAVGGARSMGCLYSGVAPTLGTAVRRAVAECRKCRHEWSGVDKASAELRVG